MTHKGPFDVFGNALPYAPKEQAERIRQRIGAGVDMLNGLAFGTAGSPMMRASFSRCSAARLRPVKAKAREFWAPFAKK